VFSLANTPNQKCEHRQQVGQCPTRVQGKREQGNWDGQTQRTPTWQGGNASSGLHSQACPTSTIVETEPPSPPKCSQSHAPARHMHTHAQRHAHTTCARTFGQSTFERLTVVGTSGTYPSSPTSSKSYTKAMRRGMNCSCTLDLRHVHVCVRAHRFWHAACLKL